MKFVSIDYSEHQIYNIYIYKQNKSFTNKLNISNKKKRSYLKNLKNIKKIEKKKLEIEKCQFVVV